jgi:hypothetical protein
VKDVQALGSPNFCCWADALGRLFFGRIVQVEMSAQIICMAMGMMIKVYVTYAIDGLVKK